MPKCINDESKRYTGDENSPKGRGYTASAEKIGKRMKGLDGRMYVVTKVGKIKKWTLPETAKKNKKADMLSPMTRRKKKVSSSSKRKKEKRVTYEDDYSSEEEEEVGDYDDLEWKLEAAEERCRLSDVFCTETLLVNVAFLAWNYFKDWYRRVRYGEDPYQVYNDIRMLE